MYAQVAPWNNTLGPMWGECVAMTISFVTNHPFIKRSWSTLMGINPSMICKIKNANCHQDLIMIQLFLDEFHNEHHNQGEWYKTNEISNASIKLGRKPRHIKVLKHIY